MTRLMTVRVPEEIHKIITEMAETQNLSVSELIRQLIQAGLGTEETRETELKDRVDNLEKRLEKLESSWPKPNSNFLEYLKERYSNTENPEYHWRWPYPALDTGDQPPKPEEGPALQADFQGWIIKQLRGLRLVEWQ